MKKGIAHGDRGWLRQAGAVLLLAVASAATVWSEVSNPHGVAVIIGNRTYQDELIPDVSYAHRDAEAFGYYVIDVLGFAPENIIDGRDAGLADLESWFGDRRVESERAGESLLWAYLDADGGSDVVVFYSGHGVPGLGDKRGYLLPSDARQDNAERDGYALDALYRNLEELEEARRITVYVDACFSGGSHGGTVIGGASPVYTVAELPEVRGERLTVLTAAMGKEVSSWDEETEHGLFTNYVLEALYGGGDGDGDGRVTAAEVGKYLDRHMTRAARRRWNRSQHATVSGATEAVLSVAVDGVFPDRPALGETTVGVVAEEETEPAPPPDENSEVAVQREVYVRGMTSAHEGQEHEEVLGFVRKLTELGGELPAMAWYYEGMAYVQLRRYEEAKGSLSRYVMEVGKGTSTTRKCWTVWWRLK